MQIKKNQGSDTIPALRFPEFKGEWEKKKLGEVFTIFNGFAFASNESVDKGVLWVKIADVGIQEMKTNNISFLPNSFTKKYSKFILKKDDYVVALTRPILSGKLKIAKINDYFDGSLLNQRVGKIESQNSKDFIYCYLQKDDLIKSIENNIAGSDPPNLSPSEINFIDLLIPTLPEQSKIASFLTAVDEKIQALKKKHSLLVQYKKGVMQQLFCPHQDFEDLKMNKSNEEKNPTIRTSSKSRFRQDDGKEFPDWEMKKLGEVGETYGGLSGKSKENFGIGKPYIQYKQIFDNSKIDISRFELVDIGENENQNKVQFGDVFFTISSETPNEIGMSSVLLDEIEELYLNSFCFGFRANSLQKLSPYFSQYLFRSEIFRTEIIKLAQGSTRYNMSKIQLLKIEINLPCLEEQTRIANFLSSLDEKINHTQTQIQQTQIWKKGLLQKMFV